MGSIDDATPSEWGKAWKKANEPSDLRDLNKHGDDDPVNSPKHYQGAIETIDYIIDVLGKHGAMAYCHGNILKYTGTRLWAKGKPIQDAKKAVWYLNKMIELMEKTKGETW